MSQKSALTLKLLHGARLEEHDVTRLDRLQVAPHQASAGADLITQGENPEHVHFVTSGVACRYKYLSDGRRAIVALLLPGDFCDLHVAILGRMDHSIGALTDCEASRVPRAELEKMLREHPLIDRACTWATLVDEAVLREWIVNVGHRTTEQQLAHLFCELFARLNAVGLAIDYSFRMPFTHPTLGDMLGASQVHIQRTMTRLRAAGLVTLQDRIIGIPDIAALAELAEFDPSYLHLQNCTADK